MEKYINKTFAVAIGLALVFATLIILFNVLIPVKDEAFIQGTCGPIRWEPGRPNFSHYPIHIRVDESAAEWWDDLAKGLRAVNDEAGCIAGVLEHATPGALDELEAALEQRGHEPVDTALVAAGPRVDALVRRADSDGHAYLRFRPADCALGYVLVAMPDYDPLGPIGRATSAKHEEGHVFGLAHDTDRRSIMYFEADESLRHFTAGDIARIREGCEPH